MRIDSSETKIALENGRQNSMIQLSKHGDFHSYVNLPADNHQKSGRKAYEHIYIYISINHFVGAQMAILAGKMLFHQWMSQDKRSWSSTAKSTAQ